MSLRPCHGRAAVSRAGTPGAGSVLARCPLPLPVVGVFILRCCPHPGARTAFASRLEQTTNSGRVYALNQNSQSPGFTVWPAGLWGGPWAQPGCDCAEPGGRLHGCPRKGSAGGPGPQGPAAHSLPAPVSRPPPRLPAWARPRDGFLLREPLGAAGSERHPRSCSDQVSLVSRSGSQPAPRAAPTLWSTRALFSKVLVDV